jgi:SAM-dependent methyltransferase
MKHEALAGWVEEAFLPSPAAPSLDGASTSAGDLWHAAPARWGHSMHTMCSYQGMFPARLAHYFIDTYSDPGNTILDPFCGRGTTVLESRIGQRPCIGIDLNPLAFVLSRAKGQPPTWESALQAVQDLEADYSRSSPPDPLMAPPEIQMLFHPVTLSQLIYLRSRLIGRPWSSWQRADFMIAGAIAGILHGRSRSDGSSAYLSLSMPNTFSMAPGYVANFIRDRQLIAPQQDVFALTRHKLARMYLDDCGGKKARVILDDAIRAMERVIAPGSVDLVVTSPPYLKVVNYGSSNWIRLWWLGLDGVSRDAGDGRKRLDSMLDHQHNYSRYRTFMERVFRCVARVLKPAGVAIFVIGDVTEPGRPTVKLAEDVWRDAGAESGLVLVDTIKDTLPEGNKVSRIWGKTRGQATELDRILVLRRRGRHAPSPIRSVNWDEPYKDAGPDSAHELSRRVGRN